MAALGAMPKDSVQTARPYFVGSEKHVPFPPYPWQALGCDVAGSATVMFRVDGQGHGYDFKRVDWQGSKLFLDTLQEFLTGPDIRFKAVPGKPYQPNTPVRFHVEYKLATDRFYRPRA